MVELEVLSREGNKMKKKGIGERQIFNILLGVRMGWSTNILKGRLKCFTTYSHNLKKDTTDIFCLIGVIGWGGIQYQPSS